MTLSKPKLQSVSATYVQRQIGRVFRRVAKDGEHLIVERGGFPFVVILPLHDYQKLTRQK
jgi:prevent-host-death family protein